MTSNNIDVQGHILVSVPINFDVANIQYSKLNLTANN